MPSPFPGMNPYLEQPSVWHDFQGVLVTLIRLHLARQLVGRYQVRMDENVYVHELDAESRRLIGRPDTHIAGIPSTVATSGPSATLLAPVQGTIPQGVDLLRERFVEIRDGRGERLVTVIELLSPTNKRPGVDRLQYLAKRQQYLHSDVNLVEIDLLRGGEPMPVTGLPPCDYCVVISIASKRPAADLWPIGLREPLPDIPIPLSEKDPSVIMPLQALLDKAFDGAGYDSTLYDAYLVPPLSEVDAEWNRDCLRNMPATLP